MTDDDLARAQENLDAIKDGLAERKKTMQPNECPGCGAFRLDGAPPQVHDAACPLHGAVAKNQDGEPDA